MIDIRVDGKVRKVAISGNVTPSVSAHLQEELDRLLDEDAKHFILDVSEMFYICSMGIGVLAKAVNRLKGVGGQMVLLRPTEQVRELLRILRIDRIIPIVDTERAALDIFPADARGV